MTATGAPNSHRFDTLIFGGGLAGSLLSERLAADGVNALLIDDPQRSICSRVAAGLINPIGGKRLKLVWLAETLIPHAIARYRQLADLHGQAFFRTQPIARLFSDEAEAAAWAERRSDPAYQAWTTPLDRTRLPAAFASADGFCIPQAGYLDTRALIETLHAARASEGRLLETGFRYDEIRADSGGVRFREYAAAHAVFCEGHLAAGNPWYAFVPYKPAKGVIGSIALHDTAPSSWPDMAAPFTIHQGKFLLPRRDGSIAVGATYNWSEINDVPDDAGIQELETFINRHFGSAWNWIEIKAGVRPATAGAYPVVGPHPEHPRIFACNGFGSKGSLQIPYFVDALAELLRGGRNRIPSEASPARFLKPDPAAKPPRWIATDEARKRVRACIEPGDSVIDATMGNGYDTHWLARAVGPTTGHVYAFDVQEKALAATDARLRQDGIREYVTLFHRGHEAMLDAIPAERWGRIGAIVFNLGYLPGGDKTLITRPDTTLQALQAGLALLRPGGILSITVYPTHAGGGDETQRVLEWVESLPADAFATEILPHPQANPNSPFPIFVYRQPQPRASASAS